MNTFQVIIKNSIRYCMGLMVLFLVTSVGSSDAGPWLMVKWVADGDTIILNDDSHVRYIGIDTPEIDHKTHRAEPMGFEAQSMNRKLVEGWQLRLEYDQEKTDHYGRSLAYVYRKDGLFVNAELLKQGYAHVLYRFPNISKDKILLSTQREAMGSGRGIWQSLKKDEKRPHAYLGNRRSRRFHAYDCPMGKSISNKNRILITNQWVGFWYGYAPAKECVEFPKGNLNLNQISAPSQDD